MPSSCRSPRPPPCRRRPRRPSAGLAVAGAAAALLLGAASAARAESANLLAASWRFATGDDLGRREPGFNDASWTLAVAGTTWENQGFANYDGFAWYRQSVTVPAGLRPDAEHYGRVLLRLGRIDDSDETYFNGTLVGALGRLPPDYASAYSEDRIYAVPANLVRWGSANVIAVRVYDGGGGGGLAAGSPSLTVGGPLSRLDVRPDFDRPDRVLLGGSQRAGLTLVNELDEAMTLSVVQGVTADDNTTMASRSDSLALAPRATARLALPGAGWPAGFYIASVALNHPADSTVLTLPFAVDPERLVSPPDRQADFQDFWDRTRAELRAVAPQFTVTLSAVQPFPTKTVYLVEMRSLGNVRIRGWLGIPNHPGPHPAILHVQGYSYGFSPTDMYSGDEFVTFALNIRGHGNSQDDVNPGFATYTTTGLESTDTYIYRGAYMDCVRAVDFLVSRPEVDASRIAVEGASQGGALAFATAALDPRVSACVPNIPGFSDYRTWFRLNPGTASGYWAWQQGHPGTTRDDIYRTLSYFDVKNLAPWIRVPTLMGVGLRDTTCPARIGFAAYNNLGGPREWLIFPESAHGLPQAGYHDYKIGWIKQQFGMAAAGEITTQPQPRAAAPGQDAAFSVLIVGAATYQWQRRPAGGTAWENLNEGGSYRGTTTAQLTVDSVSAAMLGDEFRCVLTAAGGPVTSAAVILTVVGGGGAVSLQYPAAVALDGAGLVYVADASSNTIRRITPAGIATILAGSSGAAGSADGTGPAARFNQPGGIAVDGSGTLYVADTGNATIRRITAGGAVTTLAGSPSVRGSADGTGASASFSSPTGMAVDAAGTVFVADTFNATIRRVTAAGAVTTVAGAAGQRGEADGAGGAARFNQPSGIAVDGAGNLFVADTFNHTIRRIAPDGTVTTLAGSAGIAGAVDLTGINALFNQPAGVAAGAAGTVYVADTGNGTVRRITAAGAVSTLAGTAGIAGLADGTDGNALFNQPRALAVDGAGQVFVADTGNAAIRRITAAGAVTTLALSEAGTAPPPTTTVPTTTIPPANPGSGSGSGGGGAVSPWFLALLSALAAARRWRRLRTIG